MWKISCTSVSLFYILFPFIFFSQLLRCLLFSRLSVVSFFVPLQVLRCPNLKESERILWFVWIIIWRIEFLNYCLLVLMWNVSCTSISPFYMMFSFIFFFTTDSLSSLSEHSLSYGSFSAQPKHIVLWYVHHIKISTSCNVGILIH